MQLFDDPKIKSFRKEVREFCASSLEAELLERGRAGGALEHADYLLWQKRLAEKGWLGGGWPKEYGGRGWTPIESYCFNEECTKAGTPWLLPFGVDFVGPVIFTYGTEEQKARYLPNILSAETQWCQGYSEPNAGSDLASLKTKAVRDGNDYIVNGSKIWTTMAHHADMIFALVRTDTKVKPQAGISFLLIDMKSPGVTVRPIMTIDGAHHLNEVFFDDVRVPVENRVGEENKGWHYAKFLLGTERLLSAEIGRNKRILGEINKAMNAEALDLLDSPGYALLKDRKARLEVDLLALEWTTIRLLTDGNEQSSEISVLKLRGSTVLQQLGELLVDVLGQSALQFEPTKYSMGGGDQALPLPMRMVSEFLYLRATTVYGGSNEVQRSIIAKQALGL